MTHAEELLALIRARYPLIYIVTPEERRAEEAVAAIADKRDIAVGVWSFTEGLAPLGLPGTAPGRIRADPKLTDPYRILDAVLDAPRTGRRVEQAAATDDAGRVRPRHEAIKDNDGNPTGDYIFLDNGQIYILRDYHPFLGDARNIRRLRDLAGRISRDAKCIILLGPVMRIPPELEKDVAVLDWAYPDRSELGIVVDNSIRTLPPGCNAGAAAGPEGRERIIDAIAGLTRTEAVNVLAKSVVSTRGYDLKVIMGEKRHIIRKSGILEYYEADVTLDSVGGLTCLKGWLGKRRAAYTAAARTAGLPLPRGILLAGVPGCGKSLAARACAASWGMPLVRLDIGKVFGGLVGQSEEGIRKALKTVEAAAPCVLWIDEIDKGFSGTGSSNRSDGGTTARVFGTFITWMQEKTAAVFVIATANSIEGLPPEMLRKGRFDELFFVDLPSVAERAEILAIHLIRRGIVTGGPPCNIDLNAVAAVCKDFSGSELEQVIIDAMYETFDAEAGTVKITGAALVAAAGAVVPLAVTMSSQIAALRTWAKDRARPAAPPVATDTGGLAAPAHGHDGDRPLLTE